MNRLRDSVLAGATFNRNPRVDSADRQLPYQWSWSVGLSHQLFGNSAIGADYVANASRDQLGVVDINEPVNGVRPGVAVFDPGGTIIPAEARGTNFQRVLQTQSGSQFNGKYQSLQLSYIKRMSQRWSARLAYTLQKSKYVGLGNPDARRVWLDNDIAADYGRFQFDRRHVLALSGTWNAWKTLSLATVVSAISGLPINETVGRDVNGDGDNTDRPIRGIDDALIPIRSDVDSAGRAGDQRHGRSAFAAGRSLGPLSATRSRAAERRPVLRHLQPARSRQPGAADRQPELGEFHDRHRGPVAAADAVRHPRPVLERNGTTEAVPSADEHGGRPRGKWRAPL